MPITLDNFLNKMKKNLDTRSYKPSNIMLSRGEGAWVWDTDGNKYLDCLSASLGVNQGHCHSKIRDALFEQSGKLAMTSKGFRNDQFATFCEEICTLTNSTKVLLMNSDAEVVESAIKCVRKWGYEIKGIPENKAEVIVCANTFIGHTNTIVGFSTDPFVRENFAPFALGFKVIPFGDVHALEVEITPNTAAFLVEPIQVEAGVIIPPEGYLRDIRDMCSRNNVMLVMNEIQTGLGSTGKMFAEEHEGTKADLKLVGSALSGGFYPLTAVLSDSEALGTIWPNEQSSAVWGNPLACAVGRTALRVLVEEGMIENAVTQGSYFVEQLQSIKTNSIKEIRGRGLMVAVEINPEAGGAHNFCESLKKLGVLSNEAHDHTIRFAPPLIITRDQIDWALERIDRVFRLNNQYLPDGCFSIM